MLDKEYTAKCLIKMGNQHCLVIVNPERERINVFKYNDRTCDFMSFGFDDQWAASDYILEVLPTVYYYVTVNEDGADPK